MLKHTFKDFPQMPVASPPDAFRELYFQEKLENERLRARVAELERILEQERRAGIEKRPIAVAGESQSQFVDYQQFQSYINRILAENSFLRDNIRAAQEREAAFDGMRPTQAVSAGVGMVNSAIQ